VNTPTAEQIAKLPKWAQDYIVSLQRQVNNAEDQLNRYCDTVTPTRVCFDPYQIDGTKVKYIQSDEVTFKLSTKYSIAVRIEKETLRLMANGNFRGLRIMPEVSNVIQVGVYE
jgi:hypothetical protein